MTEKPLFRGKPSREFWQEVETASTPQEFRLVIYHLACKCQELEGRLEKVSEKCGEL